MTTYIWIHFILLILNIIYYVYYLFNNDYPRFEQKTPGSDLFTLLVSLTIAIWAGTLLFGGSNG